MNAHLKKLEPSEILVYSRCIFPLKTVGPLKFWVETTDPQQDIRDGKIAGKVPNAKVFKKVEIKIPTTGYKGLYNVTPEIVLSQIDKADLSQIQGYVVRIRKPVCHYNNDFSYVAPTYYKATAILFQTGSKSKKHNSRQSQSSNHSKKNDNAEKSLWK